MLKLIRNEKGIAHFFVLFVLLIGIVVGLILLKNPKIFSPKAANNPIVFKSSTGQPLPVDPGKSYPYTTSPTIKIELTSTLGVPVYAIPKPSTTPVPPVAKKPACEVYGDLNLDGRVDANDVQIMQDIVSGKIKIQNSATTGDTQYMGVVGEVDGDNTLDVADTKMIQQYIAGQIATFSVCQNAKISPCNGIGDVTGDGKITPMDANEVLRIVTGYPNSLYTGKPYTAQQKKAADVDGDGKIDSLDSLRILRYIAGADSTFKVCTSPSPAPIVTPVPSAIGIGRTNPIGIGTTARVLGIGTSVINTLPQIGGTVSYKIAESPTALDTAISNPYTQDPMVIDSYTFKDQTPGVKFIWVEFKDVAGKIDRQNARIELKANTPSPTPSPVPVVSSTRVFVTSTTYNGNLGGLSGADAKCQTAASNANLGGTWKAWLSDNTASANSRLNHPTLPYKLLNGTVIANNWTGLTGSALVHGIDIDESSRAVSSDSGVWTNTGSDGNLAPWPYMSTPTYCRNWTSSANASSDQSGIGLTGRANYNWTNINIPQTCDKTYRLYCFEQAGATSTPTPTPSPRPTPTSSPRPSPTPAPTPSPTPRSTPTPSPITGNGPYRITLSNTNTDRTCSKNDSTCKYSTTMTGINKTSFIIYGPIFYKTDPSNLIFGYNYQENNPFNPGQLVFNGVLNLNIPAANGVYAATLYADGRRCNTQVSPPNCIAYGASSITFTVTISSSTVRFQVLNKSL